MPRIITAPGGKLIVLKPADYIGPPIEYRTRYDVGVFGKAIGIMLGREGSREVIALDIQSDMGGTTETARCAFGFDIDQEARSLGLESGAEVDIAVYRTGYLWALRITTPE
jgi:hypothetical protein